MDDATPTPPLSDRLAITALAISLVALIIGVISALQALLGTADGYRRCAPSVIGPWAALRRRQLRPSELRVETKFVTPFIGMVTPYDLQQATDAQGTDDIFLLNPPPDTSNAKRPLALPSIFRRHYDPAKVLDESLHWDQLRSNTHFTRRLVGSESKQSNQEGTEADEKLQHLTHVSTSRSKGAVTSRSKTSNKHAPRNALPVTWLDLLRHLHHLYISYWPDEQRTCENICKLQDSCSRPPQFGDVAQARAGIQETSQRNVAEWQNGARTRVAIIPIEETWDFMPPDVSRPLASSTLGVVLVLAIRLGMQWRTLDRSRSHMNADGNGYSITSTDVKSMGIVLKFNAFSHHDKLDLLIPSRAVDKMMCGIVPGDSRLVQQDFHLISNDRARLSICDEGNILYILGLPETIIAKIREQDRWTSHNEIIILLSTFLPLPCCHLRSFYFPAWRRRQYSIFHFFESRWALYNYLSTKNFKHTATTKLVLSHLSTLISRFGYEFNNGYAEVPDSAGSTQRSVDLSEWCASVFDETTKHFIDQGYASKNGTSRTWYSQLVAAQANLASFVLEQMTQETKDQETILMEYKAVIDAAGIKTTYFADRLYRLASAYAASASHEDFGIEAYMRARSFARRGDLPRADGQKEQSSSILDDWWMLMLRGLVWDMSCELLDFPGEPVPSSYYDDETSVWFT